MNPILPSRVSVASAPMILGGEVLPRAVAGEAVAGVVLDGTSRPLLSTLHAGLPALPEVGLPVEVATLQTHLMEAPLTDVEEIHVHQRPPTGFFARFTRENPNPFAAIFTIPEIRERVSPQAQEKINAVLGSGRDIFYDRVDTLYANLKLAILRGDKEGRLRLGVERAALALGLSTCLKGGFLYIDVMAQGCEVRARRYEAVSETEAAHPFGVFDPLLEPRDSILCYVRALLDDGFAAQASDLLFCYAADQRLGYMQKVMTQVFPLLTLEERRVLFDCAGERAWTEAIFVSHQIANRKSDGMRSVEAVRLARALICGASDEAKETSRLRLSRVLDLMLRQDETRAAVEWILINAVFEAENEVSKIFQNAYDAIPNKPETWVRTEDLGLTLGVIASFQDVRSAKGREKVYADLAALAGAEKDVNQATRATTALLEVVEKSGSDVSVELWEQVILALCRYAEDFPTEARRDEIAKALYKHHREVSEEVAFAVEVYHLRHRAVSLLTPYLSGPNRSDSRGKLIPLVHKRDRNSKYYLNRLIQHYRWLGRNGRIVRLDPIDLRGFDLRGQDLSGFDLTQVDLRGAIIRPDEVVKLWRQTLIGPNQYRVLYEAGVRNFEEFFFAKKADWAGIPTEGASLDETVICVA